jgi:hypothetical protein
MDLIIGWVSVRSFLKIVQYFRFWLCSLLLGGFKSMPIAVL